LLSDKVVKTETRKLWPSEANSHNQSINMIFVGRRYTTRP